MKKLLQVPAHDRPREKLFLRGAQVLSDMELLAAVFGSGTRNHDVLTLASKALETIDRTNDWSDLRSLRSIKGIGTAKAAQMIAALEFSRRRIRPDGIKLQKPLDALPLFFPYSEKKQEHFICVSLNAACEVIACRVVSVGLVDRAPVHPREVFSDPLVDRASGVIIAHNHPSGLLRPSEEDLATTRRLKEAGEILGIQVLDHIIFHRSGHYSFLEHGTL